MVIGDRVVVKNLAFPVCNSDGKRTWVKLSPMTSTGYYVGYTYKQEGQVDVLPLTTEEMYYNPGFNRPYLSNIKPVKLFRIKFTERSNDKFAFPEDVTLLEADSYDNG